MFGLWSDAQVFQRPAARAVWLRRAHRLRQLRLVKTGPAIEHRLTRLLASHCMQCPSNTTGHPPCFASCRIIAPGISSPPRQRYRHSRGVQSACQQYRGNLVNVGPQVRGVREKLQRRSGVRIDGCLRLRLQKEDDPFRGRGDLQEHQNRWRER